jgi:hypothetical protein
MAERRVERYSKALRMNILCKLNYILLWNPSVEGTFSGILRFVTLTLWVHKLEVMHLHTCNSLYWGRELCSVDAGHAEVAHRFKAAAWSGLGKC